MRAVLITGSLGALVLALAACGDHPSAVAPQAAQPSSSGATVSQASLGGSTDANVPLVGGKPMWAANRRHSATENAQYQFTRNGEDFGARTEADYVTKVHAFVDAPPAKAETLDRRNGDRLIYDARSNTFAVVSRDGAPRTMFKPRDGAAYWTQQKDREAKQAKGGSDRSSDQG